MAALLDGTTDVAVLAFAAWTVVYHAGLLVRPSTTVLLAGWLAVMVVTAAGLLRRRAGGRAPAPGPAAAPAEAVDRSPLLLWTGPAAGIAAGVAAGLHTSGVPWWVTCVLGVAAVMLTLTALWTGRGRDGSAPVADRGSLPALITAAGFAVTSLFIINPDGDDTYFVSRTVWTAEHGRIPVKDVIFTSGSVGTVGGEPPVSSVEVLNGALAHLLGVPGSSFTWYLFLPAVTFLAVWAVWRLIRLWAPRRAPACFVTAMIYLVWTGAGTGSLGSFHLLRMWQGKAVLVSMIVPLLYFYLTRWAEDRSRRTLCLAIATGIAATGLASVATFVVPLVTVAAAAPLIVTAWLRGGPRRAERLRTALAACATMAYPVAAGLAVALLHRSIEVSGSLRPAPAGYSMVLLTGTLGVLAGCALWTAPWITRRGVPALITAGIAAMATFLFIPGVLELMAHVTGAAPVVWRTMWVVPAVALVGLLAAIPLPIGLRRLAPLPAVLVCAAVVISGTPLWTAAGYSVVADRPSWKANRSHLRTARAVVAATGGKPGVVLMPFRYMRQVPLITSRVHAANPNYHYLANMPASASFIEDRRLLTSVVYRHRSFPPVAEVTAALDRVGVVVACVHWKNQAALRFLQDAGYERPLRIRGLRCVFPAAGPAPR
jgi:hypothetical protein